MSYAVDGMKKCGRCQVVKPITEYHSNRSSRDGLSGRCKKCRIESPGHSKQPRNLTRQSWQAMWQRCTDPKIRSWNRYGGRGISVCDRWSDFSAFLEDMGPRPPGMTLDRIDSDVGYRPGNCRWAAPGTQSQHTRRTVLSTPAVCIMRHLSRRGVSGAALGRAFGIDKSHAQRIVRGDVWASAFDVVVPAARP